MTKRGEHAWEEIKDPLSLSCGSLIIFYFSYVFSYATLHDVSLATGMHETVCVCVALIKLDVISDATDGLRCRTKLNQEILIAYVQ